MIMKAKLSGLLVGITLGAVALGAMANEEYVTRKGGYIGGSIGQSAYVEEDVIGSEDFEGTDVGWKIFGGYRFSRYLGVDLGYYDLGTPDDTIAGIDTEIELTGWNLSAVGTLPLGRFEFFGRLGLFSWDADAKATMGSLSGSASDSGTDGSAGIGGSWAVTKKVRIRGELEGFAIEDAGASLLSFGVDYRF
jgi:OOP family OmpA-OmpF porin